VARSLKLRTTRTLGLVITDIENPFFPELVRAVEDAALERDMVMLLCTAAEDPEREASYLDLLVDRRVDGVVIASAGLGERQAAWLARPPLPVVLANCSAPGAMLPAVLSDNRTGGRLGAEHLLALGHRTVGHLTAPARHADASDRLAGCRDALAAAGLDAEGMPVAIAAATVSGGEQAMRDLLERVRGITGVTAYNDLMAIGALRAIRACGRRAPRDVSVVGFDDVSVAALVEPALTTIVQQTREMGRLAVERLTEQLAPRTRPGPRSDRMLPHPEVTRLPVELCVRASTGPVPQ
jgi:LacI family transcriptional regulator